MGCENRGYKKSDVRSMTSQTWDEKKTRPDTQQYSRGRLSRSRRAKTARISKMLRDGPTNGPTDGPTDRHGKV